MKILVIEPEKHPEEREVPDNLEEMQKLVGGYIQAIYPFEDRVALVCNDEGKLRGLPLNRALRDKDGEIYDAISGTFFLCAAPADSDNFQSLTDEQVAKYKALLQTPEIFLNLGGKILCIPIEEPSH